MADPIQTDKRQGKQSDCLCPAQVAGLIRSNRALGSLILIAIDSHSRQIADPIKGDPELGRTIKYLPTRPTKAKTNWIAKPIMRSEGRYKDMLAKLTRSALIKANKELRSKDQSHKWPIKNRFNVTERAIRQIRQARRDGLEIESVEHYKQLIDQAYRLIVNNQRNW